MFKHLSLQLFNLGGLQPEQNIALQQVEQARALYVRLFVERIKNFCELRVVLQRNNLRHHQVLLQRRIKHKLSLVCRMLPVVEFVVLFMFSCLDNFHVVHIEQHP